MCASFVARYLSHDTRTRARRENVSVREVPQKKRTDFGLTFLWERLPLLLPADLPGKGSPPPFPPAGFFIATDESSNHTEDTEEHPPRAPRVSVPRASMLRRLACQPFSR